MKFFFLLFPFFISLIFSFPVLGVSLETTPPLAKEKVPPQITQKLTSFFDGIQNRKFADSFNTLLRGTSLYGQFKRIEALESRSRVAINTFGPMNGYDCFHAKPIGSRIFRVDYIVYLKYRAQLWQFIFYSADGSNWLPSKVLIDNMHNFFPANPQITPPPSEIQIKIEKYFLSLIDKKVDDGFKTLLQGTEFLKKEEWLENFITKTKLALDRFGKISSYELYDHRPIGNNIHIATYIAFMEKEPLRWQFFFMENPKDKKWILFNLRVDDFLEEALLND